MPAAAQTALFLSNAKVIACLIESHIPSNCPAAGQAALFLSSANEITGLLETRAASAETATDPTNQALRRNTLPQHLARRTTKTKLLPPE